MSNVTIASTPLIQANQSGAGILSGATLTKNESFRAQLANGTLADQVDTLHMKQYSFAASTPITIDLTALADVYGNPISFARVDLLAIKINNAVDGQVLKLGDSVTNEWDAFLSAAGVLTVFPGTASNDGFFLLAAPNTTGMAVTATSKTLKMDPGANAFTADVIIAGRSV